ncbi:MAG: M28 family peptidase [Phycisphaerae bacterium]|jgi:hypothetical protein
MFTRLGWRHVAALGLFLLWTNVPGVLASDAGQAAVEQVNFTSYHDFMDNWLFTHTGNNRGPSGADHDPARDNILYLFQSWGLSAQLEPFTYSSYTGENVVAELTGTTYPERIYIVAGHYDSVSNPGADDNASGISLVLEAARILSQYESECTIRFIAFDLEELGLYGSHRYVDAHASEDIRGMISADMVAYDPGTNHANIYGRTASNPIKNALAAAIDEYGEGLTYTIGGDTPYSDHAPFEAEGFQACLLIEGECWDNPYYHTQQDNFENPDNLNFPYALKMTRSAVGWLVDAAGVLVDYDGLKFTYPEGRPEYSAPLGGTLVRVEVTGMGTVSPQPGTGVLHYNTGGGWMTTAMSEVAANVYDAVLPPNVCGDEVLYYFSAEAVGGEVFTDPRIAPTTTYSCIAAYGRYAFYENTFDVDPGWTTQGLWAFGHPTGGGGDHGGPDPTNGYTGTNVYGYNLSGDYENNLPERHLTSTAIDCTGRFDVQLSFWRWLGVEIPTWDHAYVRISTNGSSWTTLWENTDEVADTAWTPVTFDIAAIADDQPTVYLRWTMGTTDTAWQYCGWNIDDVRLTALDCEPPFVAGDLNCDGTVDNFDIRAFVLALTATPPDYLEYYGFYPDCNRMLADVNGDGNVDNFDISPFVSLLTGE